MKESRKIHEDKPIINKGLDDIPKILGKSVNLEETYYLGTTYDRFHKENVYIISFSVFSMVRVPHS